MIIVSYKTSLRGDKTFQDMHLSSVVPWCVTYSTRKCFMFMSSGNFTGNKVLTSLQNPVERSLTAARCKMCLVSLLVSTQRSELGAICQRAVS